VSVDSHIGDDADWRKLTSPPELSGNATGRDVWERVGGMEGVRILRIQNLRYVNGSLTCRKILYMRRPALFSSEGECTAGFYRL
jgi:hypothetical protein